MLDGETRKDLLRSADAVHSRGSGLLEFVRANDSPAILVTQDGEPDFLMTVEFGPDGTIRRLFGQVNPEKLGHLR